VGLQKSKWLKLGCEKYFLQGHILSTAGEALTNARCTITLRKQRRNWEILRCNRVGRLQKLESQPSFWRAKFRQKAKFKIQRTKWFWRFSVAYNEEKKRLKISRFNYFGFHYVANNIEGWLKSFTIFLIYSQIWLTVHKDVSPIFLHLPIKECHFGYK
jgi:hypothetical protein